MLLKTLEKCIWKLSFRFCKISFSPRISLAIEMRNIAQKMKFSITNFFSKCDEIRGVTFTEEILVKFKYL